MPHKNHKFNSLYWKCKAHKIVKVELKLGKRVMKVINLLDLNRRMCWLSGESDSVLPLN